MENRIEPIWRKPLKLPLNYTIFRVEEKADHGMEAVHSSQTLINVYQAIQHHVLDSNLQSLP
jgi:hypothetical protein